MCLLGLVLHRKTLVKELISNPNTGLIYYQQLQVSIENKVVVTDN